MKKSEKLLRAMSLADDELVAEANPEKIQGRKKRSWKRTGAAAACITAMVAAAALWLFVPFSTDPPSVAQYADSDYYEVIQKLNEATYTKPAHKNNYEKYVAGAVEGMMNGFPMSSDKSGEEAAPEADGNLSAEDSGTGMNPSEGKQEYVEVTDNQVAGVIEADRIKRSDKYIYYLNGDELRVYSIAGEASEKAGTYLLTEALPEANPYLEDWEFYLSEDCSTVIVVASYYNHDEAQKTACVSLIALDVTDPADITRKGMVTITGAYLSSRMVDGSVLLMTQFRVKNNLDFSDETSFLPQIDTGNGMESIPADGIICPENLTNTRYTVVCKLDENTLSLEGVSAFLSYSEEVYVSDESVYATRGFVDRARADGMVVTRNMTEISRLSYAGEALEHKGSVTVEGYIKDQYSLDELQGILRVVTTTSVTKSSERYYEGAEDILVEPTVSGWNNGTNANLYCIDIETWEIKAEKLQFAPQGEIVRSVRFDGNMAYVCTSVELTDPVFFFDLSDLSNITVKDTGTIDGFSSSLINFGNGSLLGIGVGSDWGSLKLEIYEESADGVVSVCAYELPNTDYSTEYKSYYVDRKNQLIGLGICSYAGNKYGTNEYILLHFDGYELRELVRTPLNGQLEEMRAVYIDGYFYMLGGDDFVVKQVTEN